MFFKCWSGQLTIVSVKIRNLDSSVNPDKGNGVVVLDRYFHGWELTIRCDEKGHVDLHSNYEVKRQKTIEKGL